MSKPTGRMPEAPKASMKPIAAKPITPKTKSSRFFWATLIEFLERTIPASRSRKPICIIITIPAAAISQARSAEAFAVWTAVGASAATSVSAIPRRMPDAIRPMRSEKADSSAIIT